MLNLTELQQLGRAKNALASFLERRLAVPKIYLGANWDGMGLDVLAIDRAGAGDVHAVRMVTRSSMQGDGDSDLGSVRAIIGASEEVDLMKKMREMFNMPCQYRYVAIANISPKPAEFEPSATFKVNTFAEDGIGRVGIFQIDLLGDTPRVEELIRAERFRSTKKILELTDEFVLTHTADAEYRDPIYDQQVSA